MNGLELTSCVSCTGGNCLSVSIVQVGVVLIPQESYGSNTYNYLLQLMKLVQ